MINLFLFLKVIASIATSYFSGRIFEKCGFKDVYSHKYEDYRVDGKLVFHTNEPHTTARYYVRHVDKL